MVQLARGWNVKRLDDELGLARRLNSVFREKTETRLPAHLFTQAVSDPDAPSFSGPFEAGLARERYEEESVFLASAAISESGCSFNARSSHIFPFVLSPAFRYANPRWY